MLAARQLTYRPSLKREPLWRPLAFDTGDARCVLLSGRSGAGKSTFLRILCGLLPGFRGGKLEGEIAVLGRLAPRQPDGRANMLFQNTDAMLHSPRVSDELATRAKAARRRGAGDLKSGWLAELVDLLELGPLLKRRIVELSGGQQQRVAFAAVMASRPKIVLLDEPTSNLDSSAAVSLVRLAAACMDRFGVCFVAAEHKPDHWRELMDGAVRLEAFESGSWAGAPGTAPTSVLPRALDLDKLRREADASRCEQEAEPVLSCRGMSCRRSRRQVLEGVDLELRAGEIVGLTGPNGAGKSTLLLLLAGGLKADGGELLRHGEKRALHAGLLLQNPLHQLFCDTVRHEIALAAENARLPDVSARVERLLAMADLTSLADRAVLSLSYGEQQRTALAASMSAEPPAILLDEPTHGMDADRLERLARFILSARESGAAFVVASHDRDLLAAFCDRVLVLNDGKLD